MERLGGAHLWRGFVLCGADYRRFGSGHVRRAPGLECNKNHRLAAIGCGGQFAYILIAEVLTIAGIFAFIRFYKQPLNIIGLKRPRWDDLFAGLMGLSNLLFVLFAIMLAIASQVFPGLDVNQEQQIGFKDVAGTWPPL